MTIRVHIDRLVVDPGTLTADQTPRFRAALAEALRRLHSPPTDRAPRPRDAVERLAQRTAIAIHQRVVRR